ncbi:protein O-mannose kinase-like [Amphiura filiformis]|uniref:protein O-mannose kinase-like n=1 Tax=Amphiura filiformis TaxID=82378 RepID=UPI003B21E821
MPIKSVFCFILIASVAFTAIGLFVFRIRVPSDNHALSLMRETLSAGKLVGVVNNSLVTDAPVPLRRRDELQVDRVTDYYLIQEHETTRQLNDTDRHCRKGSFQLNNDGVCHRWLTCKDIQYNVTPIKRIGEGTIKKVYLARWKEYNVSLLRLQHMDWNSQLLFSSLANNMQQFQPSPFVTQFLGFCPSIPALVTEYHRFGSLNKINKILKEQNEDSVLTRFRISLDYVKIINFLHSSPTGTHVMCDSGNLNKTLSQFLVTSDLHIIVNDLDFLPVADSSKRVVTNCGSWGIESGENGKFAAPEQLIWSSIKRKKYYKPVKGFNEKSDIWKIPTVVDYLMGESFYGKHAKFKLSTIHQKCRSMDPKLRPTAAEVLKVYYYVQQRLELMMTNNV